MSAVTEVILSISLPWDPELEKTFIEDVQKWVESRGHERFEIADAGGEKELSSILLVGAFKVFETEEFLSWIKINGLYDPAHEDAHIEVIIKDGRKDFAVWEVKA